MRIVQVRGILGGKFPVGNRPGGSYPGWEISVLELSGGNNPGSNFLDGSIPSTHLEHEIPQLGVLVHSCLLFL